MELPTTDKIERSSSTDNINDNANTIGELAVTIFHDQIHYNVKHPLQDTWTFWLDNSKQKANAHSWSQNLKEAVSVDAVEDFWGVYNNIPQVDRLDDNANYHFFKKGIRPEWEDSMNASGGKFSIQFHKNKTPGCINDYWLRTMLAMISEQFIDSDQICGGVVSVRRTFFRITLWIKSADNQETIQNIGQQLRQLSNIPPNAKIEFSRHGDAAPDEGSNRITL